MGHVLFLIENIPLSSNVNGGGFALAYSHLQLLSQSGNRISAGVFISAVSLEHQQILDNQIQARETLESICKATYRIPIQNENLRYSRIGRWLSMLNAPDEFRFGNLIGVSNQLALRNLITKIKPDLVWAEDLFAVTLAQKSVPDIPVIYSHYDWKWRIKWLRVGKRGQTLRKRFELWMSRKHEEALVRKVAGCVSASATEAEEIRTVGASRVGYFPTVYEPVKISKSLPPSSLPRIVHLGGMGTTANRIGLERFLDIAWPVIRSSCNLLPELLIIGNLNEAPESLLAKLKTSGARCLGFVENLNTVLEPYDIHIVPWEQNTGTRTRIPLVLNYSQLLISTKAAAACLPELMDGENCVLVDDLYQMGMKIISFLSNLGLLQKIADRGRETFDNRFTQDAVQPRFNEFLNRILSDDAHSPAVA